MPAAPPRNGAGELSLVMGIVAFVFSFLPIVGEFIAAPAAVVAVIAGSVAIIRTERGQATNPAHAWCGIGLGVAGGAITLLVFAATSDIAARGGFNSPPLRLTWEG